MIKVKMSLNIPFYDFDKFNTIWYGNYFKYFDQVRSRLFKKINLNLNDLIKKKIYFPVYETKCIFLKKIKSDQKTYLVGSLKNYSSNLEIIYEIYQNKILVSKGYTLQTFYFKKEIINTPLFIKKKINYYEKKKQKY